MNLTQDKINSLPLPKGRKTPRGYTPGEKLYADTGRGAVPGLYLRLREGGSKKFLIAWTQGTQRRRMTIGNASVMTLEQARLKARKHLLAADEGKDPHIEKKRTRDEESLIFLPRVRQYLEARAKDMKPRSLEETRRHLLQHWKALHCHPLAKIDGDMVAEELQALSDRRGPVAANRARSTLSAFFGWAMSTPPRFKGANPVVGTKRENEESREKILSAAQLAAIWNASSPDTDYGRIVRLLMLTACRRNEIGELREAELELSKAPLIRLPAERTKNNREHVIPLNEPASAIVEATPRRRGRTLLFGEGEGGFSGWSRAKDALDKRSGITGWTLHDIRRSVATGLAELDVFPHVIEGLLNHVSGHKAGVAGIYNRASYEAQKRAALDLWADSLLAVIAQANGEPPPMQKVESAGSAESRP